MQARPTPLHGVRVIDMADGKGELCGRVLGDLGADVIRVEPPGGGSSRRQGPRHEQLSLAFATLNAGKRGIVLDIASISAKCSRAPRHGLNGMNRWGCSAPVSYLRP